MSTTGEHCDNLLAITQRPEIAAAISEHLAAKEQQLWESARQRLIDRETVLAVLGRQGIGKSTLINALVGRRILAIDETETTNVICLLKAPGQEGECVEVIFEDGHLERGPLEETFVRSYTDEQINKGNQKRVQSLVCRMKSPLLESGITLADTPGVGSLTQRTGQVTLDFLPKITTGIFVMGTAPTMLEDESIFLRSTWSFSQSFLFVQNAWAANEKELKQAEEDNLKILRDIAKDEQFTGPVDLHLVDAHLAHEGVCNERPDLVEKSGLANLRKLIEGKVGRSAALALISANGQALVGSMRLVGRAIATRITGIDQAGSTSDAEFAAESDKAHTRIGEISSQWQEARAEFRKEWQAALGTFASSLSEDLQDTEDRLIGYAEERSMDAKRLGQAVSESILLAVKAATGRLQRSYSQSASTFSHSAQDLSTDLEAASAQVGGLGGLPEDLTWTERFEKGASGLEGLGGTALTVMGGTAIYAGITTALSEGLVAGLSAAGAAVPGIGWVIAGGVLLGAWALKKHQEGKVVERLRAGIRKAVRETERKVRPGVRKAIEDHARSVDSGLDQAMRANLQQQLKVLEQLSADRRRSDSGRAEERAHLEQVAFALVRGIQDVQAELAASMRGH